MAPQRLGRYQLLRKIAVGGMAEIYLARVTGAAGFEKQVVVKRILPQLAEDDEFYQMFLDEARIAATLQHPNVVQIFDVQEADGEHFIAMEYLDGADLLTVRRILAERRQGLPIQHSVYIVSGVAAGLHYAHEKVGLDGTPLRIVHRDVTPQNVLLTRDGGVKLVDFGIAKATNRMSSTGLGTLKGKLAYMSPEQVRSAPVDRRSDIYSLGIILFELTTGRRLYRGMSELEIIQQVADTPVPPPSSILAGYPAELETIVLRALSRDPATRYQTALELQRELEAFARRHGAQSSALALSEWVAPLLAIAEQQVEARLQRRQAATPSPAPRVIVPARSMAGALPDAAPAPAAGRARALPRPDSDPSMLEVAPDLGEIRLRRGRFLPALLVLLLLGAAGGALYYVEVMRPDRAGGAAADAGPARPPRPAEGTLRVSSSPEGAAVWLRLGRTPVEAPVQLDRAQVIRVEHDGYRPRDLVVQPDDLAASGAGPTAVKAELEPAASAPPPEEPTALPAAGGDSPAAPAEGRLRVTSDPPAATVWLLVAITPGEVGPLDASRTTQLRIARTGHLPAFRSVAPTDHAASGRTAIAVELAPRPEPGRR